MMQILRISLALSIGAILIFTFWPRADSVSPLGETRDEPLSQATNNSSVSAVDKRMPDQATDGSTLGQLGSNQESSLDSLIDALGAVNSAQDRKTNPRAAFETQLSAHRSIVEMGAGVAPAVVKRLQDIPALEQALTQQPLSADVKQKLNSLQARKYNLIKVLGAIGEPHHASDLLGVVNNPQGRGVASHFTVYNALRGMKAHDSAEVYRDELFADLSSPKPGPGGLLSMMATLPNPSQDAEFAVRTAKSATPASGVLGYSFWLAARVGVADKVRNEILQALQDSIADDADGELILMSFAEIARPGEFDKVVDSSVLGAMPNIRNEVVSARLHNKFWWATDDQRELQLDAMLADGSAKNVSLALNYLLVTGRDDLLVKHGVVTDKNLYARLSNQPGIEPSYSISDSNRNFAQMAGFKLTADGAQLEYEPIAGFGWYSLGHRAK